MASGDTEKRNFLAGILPFVFYGLIAFWALRLFVLHGVTSGIKEVLDVFLIIGCVLYLILKIWVWKNMRMPE